MRARWAVGALGALLGLCWAATAEAADNHRFAAALALAPDGRLAVGEGARVRLFDRGGHELGQLTGHTDEIAALAWSSRGELASAGRDERVLVWDVVNGRVLHALEGHGAWLAALAWSPDGKRLATAGGGKRVHVWDVDGSREVVLEGHTEAVMALAWSPDGAWLASTGDDTSVRLWEVASGRQVAMFEAHTHMVRALAWSGDGAWLASGGRDKAVKVWDVAAAVALFRAPVKVMKKKKRAVAVVKPSPVRTLAGAGEAVVALVWDGMEVEAATARGAVLRWGEKGGNAEVVVAAGGAVHAATFGAGAPTSTSTTTTTTTTPDGGSPDAGAAAPVVAVPRLIALSRHDASTQVGPAGDLRTVILPNALPQAALGWGPDGKTLATGGPGAVGVWPVSGHMLGWARFVAVPGDVLGLAYDAGGRLGLAGSSGGAWLDVERGVAHALGPPSLGWCRAVVASSVPLDPAGSRLATACDDGEVHLWDPGGVQSRGRVLAGHTGWVTALALDPATSRLASGSDDRSIRLWDVRTSKLLATLTGHTGPIRALAFDGDRIISGAADGTVRVWEQGVVTATYAHEAEILALAVGPDHVIAAGDHDGTIRLWPAGKTLPGHRGPVRALAFAPGPGPGAIRPLASVGDDGTLRLWTAAGHPLASRRVIETLAVAGQSVKMPPGTR